MSVRLKGTIHANGTPFCNELPTALCSGKKVPACFTNYNPGKVTCVVCLRRIIKNSNEWLQQILNAVFVPPGSLQRKKGRKA